MKMFGGSVILLAITSSSLIFNPHLCDAFAVPNHHASSFISTKIAPLRRTSVISNAGRFNSRNKVVPTTSKNTATQLNMISYEQLMEKLPSKAVIDAVEASRDGKVIASDVASSAGVSLSQARKDLTALASISQGDIAVSKDGELIYSFPSNLSSVLASRSSKFKTQELFRKVWPNIFWAIRVSFGVALVASLVAIFSAIVFIQSGSSSDDDRDDRRGGGGFGGMGYFWGPSPFDFFYYRPYGGYGYYGEAEKQRDPEDMGFFESVFSYIFGDGDPNTGIEEKRLSLVAQLIRDNKGAVTAEQLAPFCDDAPSPSKFEDSVYPDESFVLPIVTQLNGEPRVTDSGDIVYVFPDLQLSASTSSSSLLSSSTKEDLSSTLLRKAGLRSDASAREIKQLLNFNGISTRGALDRDDLIEILEEVLPPLRDDEKPDDPDMLNEREYKFSVASDFNKVLAGGLGVVNLGGALYLGNLIGQYALYGVQLPPFLATIVSIYPALLGYAVLFNVIPLARSFWIKSQNAKISQRNAMRRNWKTALASAVSSSSIGRKLKDAKSMGIKMKRLGGKDDVVFDTRDSIEDIEKKKEKSDLDEFDKLLGN